MCDMCHKTFRDTGSVKLHQCVHTGECPYCCDVYNKTFSNIRISLLGSVVITVKSVLEHSVKKVV